MIIILSIINLKLWPNSSSSSSSRIYLRSIEVKTKLMKQKTSINSWAMLIKKQHNYHQEGQDPIKRDNLLIKPFRPVSKEKSSNRGSKNIYQAIPSTGLPICIVRLLIRKYSQIDLRAKSWITVKLSDTGLLMISSLQMTTSSVHYLACSMARAKRVK